MTTFFARAIEGVPVVASETERDLLFAVPTRDQRVQIRSNGDVQRYDGVAWVSVPGSYGIEALEKTLGLVVTDVRHPPGCAHRYGAVGDGVMDDTAAIQAALNYASQKTARYRATLLAGNYKTTDTLHVGYGVNYTGFVFEGAGGKYRGDEVTNPGNQIVGSLLVPTFSDRPCLSVQGSRGTCIRRIGLKGKLYDYLHNNVMGSPGDVPALLDDTVVGNWNDPALAATQDSRYTPYAGIAVDPYAGVAPGTAYPNVTFPAFLGAPAQYGKLFSSNVTIEDCYIAGFSVGVANQPCDADGNGDFTKLQRCYIECCKWVLSVGNSQSRNVGMEDCVVSAVYAVLTNNQHGRQQGKFGGHIDNLSCYGIINLFQFREFYAEQLVFTGLYCESIWRIGDLTSLSGNEGALIFTAPEFLFSSQTDVRGYPAMVLGGGQQLIGITFDGFRASLYNQASVAGFFQFGIAFDGLSFLRHDAARVNTYEQLAHNALCGGFVFPNLVSPDRFRVRCRPYNLDTGVVNANSTSTAKYKLADRRYCAPIFSEAIAATSDDADKMTAPVPTFPSVAKAALTSATLVGKELTLTFAARTDTQFMQGGPLPGDVIIDDQTQSVFFVRARAGLVVNAVLQNNFKMVVGVATPLVAISMAVGNFLFRNSRIYTPTFYTRGDCTAASNLITTVGRDDGGTGHVVADIAVGDALLVQEQRDFFMSANNNPITAVAAAQLTLTGSVNMRTQVRRRLDWFVRQPPANV